MKHADVRHLSRPATPRVSRALVSLIVLAVPIFALLMLAFQHVVRSSLEHGKERRAMTVQQVSAAKSCNTLANVQMQEQCLLALSAVPGTALGAAPGAAMPMQALGADSHVASPVDEGALAAVDQPLKARIK